jgi:putative tryptophan/tyrosine transport system substrate-binding protein
VIVLRRRQFIFIMGGTAAAWSLPLRAQQGAQMRHIGVLLFGTPDTDPNLGAFLKGLRDLGYEESKNITIEYRYAEGNPDRLGRLAGELVGTKPDLIFALGGDVAPSARTATSTIPVVAAVSNDPVQAGLVASLARPGGNITGVTFVSSDLAAKRLQMLREIAPDLGRVAVIWNPDHVDPEYRETQTAAKRLGIQIQSLEVRSVEDFTLRFRSQQTRRFRLSFRLAHDSCLRIVPALFSFQTNTSSCLRAVLDRGQGRAPCSAMDRTSTR